MTALAAIHVGRKALGLDEDTYRALLVRVTGKSSAGQMDAAERDRVVSEMRRLGFNGVSKAPQSTVTGRFAPVIRALWISAYHLDLVRDRTDAALISFVKRQTNIDHLNWLRDWHDARRVIEALKGWMAREAGVRWPRTGDDAAARQAAVIEAQARLLAARGIEVDLALDADPVTVMKQLGARLRKVKKP